MTAGSGTTATWSIPYPTRTDPLCDPYDPEGGLPGQFRAMAEVTDDAMTSVEVDLPRLEAVPFARMSSRVTYTATLPTNTLGQGQGLLTFDSVDVDTDNMANLSESVNGIFANRAGYWECGYYIHLDKSNTSGSNSSFRVDFIFNPDVTSDPDNIFQAQDYVWDGGTTNTDNYLSGIQTVRYRRFLPAIPGPLFSIQLTKNGAYSGGHLNDQVVDFSTIYCRWVRDA